MSETPVAETAERLLRLLSLLTVHRCWRADELAERLGVTPRTVRRDVGRLRGLGYQVSAVPGPGGGYELGAGSALPPMLLDDEAAVAVAVGLRVAASGAVAGMAEAAVRAMAVIDRVLPDRLRRRAGAIASAVVPLPAGTPPVDPDLLGLLALACRDSERLRFSYTDGDGLTSNRHAVPFRLVSTGRRWYLVARDLERDDWRSFRLDRIADPRPTGVRSAPADPPDAARFVAEGVTTRGYPSQARILLHAPAQVVAEHVPPTVAVIEATGERECVLLTGAYRLDMIALHMASLGIAFTPLWPPELRTRCAELSKRLAAAAGRPCPGDCPGAVGQLAHLSGNLRRVTDAIPPARGAVTAWGLWDWAFSAFNAVATTFVFNTYLSSSKFGNPARESELLGAFMAVAGVTIAVIAPVAGQRTDASGHRKLWLAINSGVVALCLLGTVFVRQQPGYLWLGLLCIAVGTVFYELASVFYNSLLPLVSTRQTVGRVSAFGWSMGYFGGIVLLVIILVFFVEGGTATTSGLLHIPDAGGLYVRLAMLVATAWAVGFSIPVFVKVRVPAPAADIASERTGFFASYRLLLRNVRDLWRVSPNTIWFLLASAIFRDGLTGVFTFGGVLGHVAFGLSTKQVLVFGIAANVVAGIATVLSGRLDDRLGPKPVIVASLAGMSACAIALFVTRGLGAVVFWIFGLVLCTFVGPAQSASRTFLSRVIPPGREGEVFGLYATTGRAAIWLSPALYSAAIALSPATGTAARTSWGILGVLVVILAGLAVLLPVKPGQDPHRPRSQKPRRDVTAYDAAG